MNNKQTKQQAEKTAASGKIEKWIRMGEIDAANEQVDKLN